MSLTICYKGLTMAVKGQSTLKYNVISKIVQISIPIFVCGTTFTLFLSILSHQVMGHTHWDNNISTTSNPLRNYFHQTGQCFRFISALCINCKLLFLSLATVQQINLTTANTRNWLIYYMVCRALWYSAHLQIPKHDNTEASRASGGMWQCFELNANFNVLDKGKSACKWSIHP